MAKRFVLGRNELGDVALASSHTIGSLSDTHEQAARGITATVNLDTLNSPSIDVALTRLPQQNTFKI